MSATKLLAKPSTIRHVAGILTRFRLIPRIETYPSVVSFAQTALGRVALLAVFGLELLVSHDSVFTLVALLLLGLMTFMPEYRRLVLAIAPFGIALVQTPHSRLLFCMTLAVVGGGIFLYWCAMRWPKSRFGQRPIVFLLTGFSVLILFACLASPHTLFYPVLWSMVGVSASYLWFIAYALTDRTSKPSSDLTLELAAFRPLWGSTNTPFPKGAAYLRRIEARDSKQLAIVQLKALKLFAWAILLALFSSWWNRFFHGALQIPTSAQALASSVHRAPVAWHVQWESLILAFFESILTISIMGHQIIAICRMAGFNALRNTYRPLSSTTIADFFNRFYYYFKELLVDFFFYPAFLRYWKGHQRLRMVYATFAAAFFGNAFYHFTRDWQLIQSQGFWVTLTNFESYLFYCIVLALGLSISQLRKRKPKTDGFVFGKLFPALGVCIFYCLLNIFDSDVKNYPFVEHLRFLASLFFIHF